ncbi:MAG TPA: HDOD domain-containing protein [Verrucomicrobiae bacterium]|jgi:putative nucleotidyltransferase with HDIG domain|nr:HDOD domain-containing protein [Verrucomicrobiae bacterium]
MNRLEEIRPRIDAMEAMPTVPSIVQPLTELLRQAPEQVPLDKVVELVSYDSTIAAQCLRMANSPLFGRRNSESVRGAVLALGIKRIGAIVLGCCLNQIVSPKLWAMDALGFWRHSMACALVSNRVARLIGYPDADKAYLAGLLHDLGILVNTVVCSEDFGSVVRIAQERHRPLHELEREHLGFTHCQSGKILAEKWKFSPDVIAVVEFHHDPSSASSARPLVALVHLSDLLCRLRDLGYGYYEAMGVDLAGDSAWACLLENYPKLANMDLARLTMDLDGAMEEITSLVSSVFQTSNSAAQAH